MAICVFVVTTENHFNAYFRVKNLLPCPGGVVFCMGGYEAGDGNHIWFVRQGETAGDNVANMITLAQHLRPSKIYVAAHQKSVEAIVGLPAGVALGPVAEYVHQEGDRGDRVFNAIRTLVGALTAANFEALCEVISERLRIDSLTALNHRVGKAFFGLDVFIQVIEELKDETAKTAYFQKFKETNVDVVFADRLKEETKNIMDYAVKVTKDIEKLAKLCNLCGRTWEENTPQNNNSPINEFISNLDSNITANKTEIPALILHAFHIIPASGVPPFHAWFKALKDALNELESAKS